jgi:hypothetical protein
MDVVKSCVLDDDLNPVEFVPVITRLRSVDLPVTLRHARCAC